MCRVHSYTIYIFPRFFFYFEHKRDWFSTNKSCRIRDPRDSEPRPDYSRFCLRAPRSVSDGSREDWKIIEDRAFLRSYNWFGFTPAPHFSTNLSRIRLFSIPDPNFFHPGSTKKNLSILTQKIVFKLTEIWCGLFIPDGDFLPNPGSRGQKGTGSRIWIRNPAASYRETSPTLLFINFFLL